MYVRCVIAESVIRWGRGSDCLQHSHQPRTDGARGAVAAVGELAREPGGVDALSEPVDALDHL